MRAQALWSFNRFEISRILWKATAVPALTYANSVSNMPSTLLKKLAIAQNEVGRWALGIPNSKVATTFIEGELGWSSFPAREAQSKIRFFNRVKLLPETRWVKAILNMMELTNVKTAAYERMLELRKQFGCEKIELTYLRGLPCCGKFNRDIREQIGLALDDVWRQEMEEKSTLARYRKFKDKRGSKEVQYENSRGSALLALARAGALPTRVFRTRFTNSDNGEREDYCRECQTYPETIEHVLHECGDRYYEDIETDRMLGFTDDPDPASISRAKRRLEIWERENPR